MDMNRYEKTHRELKKQLEQLISSESEFPGQPLIEEDVREQVEELEALLNAGRSSSEEQVN